MGFVDKLRSAKHFGYSNPNLESDRLTRYAINKAMDDDDLDRAREMRGEGGYLNRSGGGGYLNRGEMRGPESTNRLQETFNKLGIRGGQNFDGMDVIYDQRPEMFQKQLNLQKQGMAQNTKLNEAENALNASKANDDFIDNRRSNALRQQQVETQDWTARNLKPGELERREELNIIARNQTALEAARGKNNLAERELQNQGIRENNIEENIRGVDKRVEENARVRQTAELAAATKAEASNTPKNQADALNLRIQQLAIENPQLANGFKQDDKGNFYINNKADEVTRRAVARLINPNADIPSVPGINANIKTNAGPVPKSEDNPVNRDRSLPGNQPPKGANPNGMWKVLSNGRRVWMEK